MEIIRERIKQRRKYIEYAFKFTDCALKKLGDSTLILYGSVARGDFNEWSDIDILVVTRGELPLNPLKRLDLIYECIRLYPRVEPVIVTLEEYRKMLRKGNPLVLDAVKKGITLVDRLGISSI